MLEQLFEESRKAIEKHYDESMKKTTLPPELCGYRFLLSSKSTFRADIPIMIIDDHPGPNFKQEGKAQYSRELELKDYPYPSCENVSAYIGEDWDEDKPKGYSDMQVSMRVIMNKLMQLTRYSGTLNDFALKGVLALYGNPYRKGFHGKALRPIWKNIFDEIQPPLIFVLGKDVFPSLVLNYFGIAKEDVDKIETGQTNYSFKLREVTRGSKKSLLVYMAPHSRFPYGKENGAQLAAVNDMWNRVRTFISDNNL
ncbi:hypothetical protein [Mailhella sp.]